MLNAAAYMHDRELDFELAWRMFSGIGCAVDKAGAALRFRTSAEQGYDFAQLQLGKMLLLGDGIASDQVEAVAWFTQASASLPEAQYNLGLCYGEGRGVIQNEAQAAIWFLKAAEGGDLPAKAALGSIYTSCHKYAAAVPVFQTAALARAGDARAQYNLALCLMEGVGVQKDVTEGMFWLQCAASQGILPAMPVASVTASQTDSASEKQSPA